jgi:ribonuclease Z
MVDDTRTQPKEGDGDGLDGFLREPPLVRAVEANLSDLEDRGSLGDSLEVWLTGTGTPVVLPHRFGPSTVLRAGEEIVVVDCGNGTAYQLAKIGIGLREVTHVFITHHHVDHNVDLGFILLSPWAQRGSYRPPYIIGPPGTLEYVNRVLAAHDYDLRVRIPHGFDPQDVAPPVVEIENGDVIHGATWRSTAFRVDHTPVDQAFGYRFDTGTHSVVISGDTKPCDNLIEFARGTDVLVHEAIFPGFGIPEYHTLSTDVGEVASRARAKRLVLTHLIPGDRKDEEWLDHARQNYDGPITVGHDLLKVM